MDMQLNKVLEPWIWPIVLSIVLLIAMILFIVIFKKPIAELIRNITGIELDPRNRKFKIDFKQRISKAKAQSLGIEKTVAASGISTPDDKIRDFKQQTARDAVLEAWGSVKQIVYDACMAKRIQLTPATVIPEAIRQLSEAKAIDSEVAGVIRALYDLGDTMANDTGLRPLEDDARAYKGLADVVRNWMMLSILPPAAVEEAKSSLKTPRPRRQTLVGSEPLPQARSDQFTAMLVGTDGVVKGRHVSMTGEYLRIGRISENDLSIPGDDCISGNHAYLHFKNDRLLLYDQNSRNGTFLNKQRVTGPPLEVKKGDLIQIGNSVFQVTETSLAAASHEEKKGAAQQSARRDTTVQ